MQVPTLSDIRSRISMLDETREKQPSQTPIHAANLKLTEQKQTQPPISPSLPSATPAPSSAAAAGFQLPPPYALLQAAPQTAISRRLASTYFKYCVLSPFRHSFVI
jgi:hypothetical protein